MADKKQFQVRCGGMSVAGRCYVDQERVWNVQFDSAPSFGSEDDLECFEDVSLAIMEEVIKLQDEGKHSPEEY